MKKITFPGWFRDSLSRVSEDGIVVRMNEDSEREINAIARQLGWSYARVVRVLVNRGLSDMRQDEQSVA